MYAVEFTSAALKEFRKLPDNVRKTMRTKLERLAKDPLNAQGVKVLKGEDAYRLRVGDYRIVYALDKGRLIITVIRTAHRREVYD